MSFSDSDIPTSPSLELDIDSGNAGFIVRASFKPFDDFLFHILPDILLT